MEEYTTTPKQFYKAFINNIYQSNRDFGDRITKKEIRELYPFESVYRDCYLPKLYEISSQGIRVADRVLDKIEEGPRYQLMRFAPSLYESYLPANIRRRQRR
jgi:hypothetical protein